MKATVTAELLCWHVSRGVSGDPGLCFCRSLSPQGTPAGTQEAPWLPGQAQSVSALLGDYLRLVC